MKILGDELEAKFLAVPGPHIPDPYDADAPLANNPPEALLGPGAGTRPTAVLQQTNLQEVTEAIRQTFNREDFEAAWLQVCRAHTSPRERTFASVWEISVVHCLLVIFSRHASYALLV